MSCHTKSPTQLYIDHVVTVLKSETALLELYYDSGKLSYSEAVQFEELLELLNEIWGTYPESRCNHGAVHAMEVKNSEVTNSGLLNAATNRAIILLQICKKLLNLEDEPAEHCVS